MVISLPGCGQVWAATAAPAGMAIKPRNTSRPSGRIANTCGALVPRESEASRKSELSEKRTCDGCEIVTPAVKDGERLTMCSLHN